jgi:hypothetical protein
LYDLLPTETVLATFKTVPALNIFTEADVQNKLKNMKKTIDDDDEDKEEDDGDVEQAADD